MSFYPFALETAGTWHQMAIELTQEIGRRITTITEDTRETTFLFQRKHSAEISIVSTPKFFLEHDIT